MKVDMSKVLTTMDGKALMESDDKGEAIEVTAQAVVVNALLTPVQNEKGVDKLRKFELAKKVHGDNGVDLDEDDIKLIKDRVGEVYAPLIVGQIYDLLKV